MKIYLASFLEQQNFGPGKLVGICNGQKPDHVDCNQRFMPFVPSLELMKRYNDLALTDYKFAVEMFVSEYTAQLDAFYNEVMEECNKTKKTPQEILPLTDGMTLATWERQNFSSYRGHVAKILEKLGYEVVLK